MDAELLTTLEAGKILGVSAERVRQLEATGRLTALRTATGQRIFRLAEVQRLRDEREAKRCVG